MKYRKLRIAWSVAWGVAAVLFVALWVRSFWRWDEWWVTLPAQHFTNGISAEGRIIIWVEHARFGQWFEFSSDPLAIHRSPPGHARHPWCGFYISPSGNSI